MIERAGRRQRGGADRPAGKEFLNLTRKRAQMGLTFCLVRRLAVRDENGLSGWCLQKR